VKIKLKSVRIYGSKDYYGSEPRTTAEDQPILLDNYPKKGYRVELWLGDISKDILKAYRVKRGIGRMMIERLAGLKVKDQNEINKLIESYMKEQGSEFKVEKWNWYISLIIEQIVEIDDKFINDNKYLWLESKKLIDLEKAFYESTQIYHDRLATFVLCFIEPAFFSEICLEGVFFDAEGKISFGFPKFTASAEVHVSKNMDSLRLIEFEEGLKAFSKVSDGSHKFIDKARHWYLSSLRESDPWKRFIFNFYALEILVHKLSSKYYNSVCHSFKLKSVKKSKEDKTTKVISELVPKKERLDLVSKFAIMALRLSPNTAWNDLESFKTIKKARDNLSHGNIRNAEELPNQILFSLLKKYFDISVKG